MADRKEWLWGTLPGSRNTREYLDVIRQVMFGYKFDRMADAPQVISG
jgi:hypothetical protein